MSEIPEYKGPVLYSGRPGGGMSITNLMESMKYVDDSVTFDADEMKEIEAWMDEWLKPGKGNSVTDRVYRKVCRLKLRDETRVNTHCMDGRLNEKLDKKS